jgi:hypothetical protein
MFFLIGYVDYYLTTTGSAAPFTNAGGVKEFASEVTPILHPTF